jgi:exodeoxyribonuclease-3
MKLISWNVNGLRACLTHGFADSFAALDADIFSVQETKMQPGQADFAPEGYTEYTYSAEKKGYSGTACWCRQVPLAASGWRNMTTKAGCSRWNTRAFIW